MPVPHNQKSKVAMVLEFLRKNAKIIISPVFLFFIFYSFILYLNASSYSFTDDTTDIYVKKLDSVDVTFCFEELQCRPEFLFEAIVALATGTYATSEMVDGFFESLRGKISTPLYLVTDRTDCFKNLKNVNIIEVPTCHGKMESQSNKAKVFQLLPEDVSNFVENKFVFLC